MKEFAPVILFVYNRPVHTYNTLLALKRNVLSTETSLFIFADGFKKNATTDEIDKVVETRKIIRQQQWCKEVIINESDYNKGLADSIVAGVTQIVNEFGKVIVLEDDLITSPGFLTYMNKALFIYENDVSVMHVSGYMYPAKNIDRRQSSFFLNILSCWGWGTWKRAWKNYSPELDKHLKTFSSYSEISRFDIQGHADYFDQLISNLIGKKYTWAVRWYASWLSSGGYSLFPSHSLVQNSGFDNSGDNCSEDDIFKSEIAESIVIKKEQIIENQSNRKAVDTFYRNNKIMNRSYLKRLAIIIAVNLKIIKAYK